MVLVVVDQGTAFRFARADLAGRPFASHLPEQFLSLAAADAVVIDPANPLPGQPDSLGANLIAVHDLLFVASNAWFSAAALERLFLLVSQDPAKAKLVCNDAHDDVSGAPAPLAVYLPSAKARDLLAQQQGPTVFDEALADLGSRITNCELISPATLDPALPPVQIQNLLDLAILERNILYARACAALLRGIRIRDPARVAIRGELQSGDGVEIDIDVIFEGKVILGEGVRIGAGSILINSTIGPNTRVNPFSIVENSVIGSDSFVGPYGRVRPGSIIGDSTQIGNFVEIKNSNIGSGSRINHHAFVGDATLGNNVTIGAGSITCNHDGAGTRRTEIKAGAYVGSGCKLVAPLSIGENATVGAGSTITEDVPAGKLTLARSRQVTVENWVRLNDTLPDK